MGFLSGRQYRTLENPSVPLSAGADWLYDALGATRSGSGVRVSRETSLTYSPVWRAVNLISGDVARIPLILWKFSGRGKELDKAHPAYRLLRHEANDEMSALTVKETVQFHALLMGNGYIFIDRDKGTHEPIELIPLVPDKTYPVRKEGQLFYITEVAGEIRWLYPKDVMHIKGLGYEGLAGYSVVAKARESFGLGMAMQRYGGIFFRNNATPSGVLTIPGQLSDTALKRLKDSWNQEQGGLERSHKLKILEEGMSYTPISINSRDAQLVESRGFEIREVANWFSVPPHKLGDSSRTSYNSLEQENQAYLDECLEKWFGKWEIEAWSKLLTEEEKRSDSHVFEFNRHSLVRADREAMSKICATNVQYGIFNPDEARAEFGYGPKPDGTGSKFYMAGNISPDGGRQDVVLDEEDDPEEPATPTEPAEPLVPSSAPVDDGKKTKARSALAGVARRMCKRLSKSARTAARNSEAFFEWLDSFRSDHERTVDEAFGEVLPVVSLLIEPKPDAIQAVLFDELRERLLDASGGLKPHEFEDGIGRLMDEFEANEPERLAALVVG